MPAEIKITKNDIGYAEGILLPEGKNFSEQGEAFIKNLKTIDLQAVPGSGKTTVLLAKLLILEKHIPFDDGSGILVISHTNTAVDEIKKIIGNHCSKILTYPNFIGTIQSFVNKFLAIPYYKQKHTKNPLRIDKDIYYKRHYVPHKAYGWLKNRQDKNEILYSSRLLDYETLGYDLSKAGGDFPLKTKTGDTYISLLTMKKKLREDGVLCFDDAYILAKEYLSQYPDIAILLQKRFRYVFVDEMQDMDKHQYDLLECLFYDTKTNSTVFQRIGDKNQSIFSGKVKLEDIWRDREKILPLTGSRRLPKSIAQIVSPFALDYKEGYSIDGLNITNEDGTVNDISPHVIVFDDNTVEKVIPKFCELVNDLKNKEKIPEDCNSINAIAWIAKEGATFGIRNYWGEYGNRSLKKIYSRPLSTGSLKEVHRGLIDVILKVLWSKQIVNPETNKHFTGNSLKKYLRETNEKYYDRFRLRLFEWSREIYKGNSSNAYQEIKRTIPRILHAFFGIELNNVNDIINDDLIALNDVSREVGESLIYECPHTNVKVKVGTVHSVKGETHTATLYLESYYDKGYESTRLKRCFDGNKHDFSLSKDKDVRKKETIKMVYVGFSRPTHLLCFAVHKDRYDIEVFQNNGWKHILLQ